MERYSEPFEDLDVYCDSPDVIARPPRIALAFLAAALIADQFMTALFLYEPLQYLGGPVCLLQQLHLRLRQCVVSGRWARQWKPRARRPQ